MKIGIIGLPFCGKTTVFNALTQAPTQEVSQYAHEDALKPHLRAVKISDERLDKLSSIFNPKKTTPVEITFLDMPPSRDPKVYFKDLVHFKEVNAFVHVIRFFKDEAVLHIRKTVDPIRDFVELESEMLLLDMQPVTKRINTLQKENKRDCIEYKVLEKCLMSLEAQRPLYTLGASADETKVIAGFELLSLKSSILAANIGEEQIEKDVCGQINKYAADRGLSLIELCAKAEFEISQLDPKDRALFMEEMGIKEPVITKFIRTCFGALGFVSFFTVVGSEVRAWLINKNTRAQDAAGKVHTDMAKGFIRAEVINCRQFFEAGSFAAAKEKGLLKLEGKDYLVQDGDIINFRFSV